MKIQFIDQNTKKPLMSASVQLQIRGQDSGYLTLTTDPTGFAKLDDKYKGQQATTATAGGQGQWMTLNEGVTLTVTGKTTTTAGAGGVGGAGGKQTTTTHK